MYQLKSNKSSGAFSSAEVSTPHHNKPPKLPLYKQAPTSIDKSNQAENMETLQRKPLQSFAQKKEKNNTDKIANDALGIQLMANKSSGNCLDSQTKSFMESRFGTSFQDVQVHANKASAALSEQLNAKAFTIGSNIYFNEGKYAPNTTEGKRLLAHELTHTVQQNGADAAIQKEDKDKPATAFAPKPEIDFKLLPPDFQLKLFHFLLAANTSTVHLDYNAKSFMAGLSYQYGDALSLNMRFNDFKSKLGWTPGSNNLSLGLNYKGFDAKLTGSPTQQKFGVGLHYGAPLLPMQDQMANTFNAGGTSFGNLLTGLPSAFHDPIAFYQQNKAEVENVTKTADLVKQITEAGKSKIRFGGDFSLTYDPVNKVVVTAKVGLMF